MRHNLLETILGAAVLAVAVAFLSWAYVRSGSASSSGGYALTAQFDRIDGLDVGADVRVSGISVGKVQATELDPKNYRATVRFTVRPDLELPSDSSAAIVSASLLGGKYLALVPGGDDRMLKAGQAITLTQSSVNLEDLIGRYIFGGGGQSGAEGATPK